MELFLQVLEARVDVTKLLVYFPKVVRDVPFQGESTFELSRAVAARVAAPATAELPGKGFSAIVIVFGISNGCGSYLLDDM